MRRALLGALLTTMVGASPAGAATAFSVGAGTYPHVVTGHDGTAHVAWQADNAVRYCRVPKGATACSASHSLAFPGNATSGNQTWIVNPANGVVQIVTHRSSSSDPSIDGAYLASSASNGTGFAAPVKVGRIETRGGVVPGPGTGVSAVTEQSTDVNYQRMPFPAISNNTSVTSFDPPSLINDLPTVAVPTSGRPVVAWSEGNAEDIAYRQYKSSAPAASGNGPPPPANVTGNWAPLSAIAGQGRFPKLAAGPNGTVLQYLAAADKSLRAVRMNPATEAFAPPEGVQTVSPPGSISSNDMSANRTSGHFHSVWKFTGPNGTEVRYSRSDAGTAWTAPVPILRDVGSASYLHVSGAPDDSGWLAFDNGSGDVSVAPLEAIADPPPGGGTPNPNPGSGTPNPAAPAAPGTAPSNQIGQVTVGNEVIQLFGPTSCVTPGQKVKLRVTSKRKKKLAGSKGRSKIRVATFYVDKTRKKDRKKAFAQTFKTDGFAPGSKHKLGAALQLKQLFGKKKGYKKNLKGTFSMCG